MKHEIDLEKFEIRTDLITETITGDGINDLKKEVINYDDISLETIILDDSNASKYNKKPGIYKTISFEDVTDMTNRDLLEKVLVDASISILKEVNFTEDSKVLIIGLGNEKSTADSLGPLTIDNTLTTRHLFLLGNNVEPGFSSVASFKPGVMGVTGVETFDIIMGIVEGITPDIVIVIDSLAASNIERLNKTIQICNTGIHPGSGIGNNRKELSKETIGIPVIAIGVPTVVDFLTIVDNTFDYLLKKISYSKDNLDKVQNKMKVSTMIDYRNHNESLSFEDKEKLLGSIGGLTTDERRSLLFEVLAPLNSNLMVTPKEIDFVIEKLALVIGKSLNKALHSKLREEN